MNTLSAIPALIRILFVFAVILFCINRKLPLGSCFCLGAVALGFVFGMVPAAIIKSAIMALADPKTLSLAAVVSLILVLSHSLEAAGQMNRLLDRFQGLVRIQALNIVIFPALIGLLPMPGGAIFSAPMVKNLGAPRAIERGGSQLRELLVPSYLGVLVAALSRCSFNHRHRRHQPLVSRTDGASHDRCGCCRRILALEGQALLFPGCRLWDQTPGMALF